MFRRLVLPVLTVLLLLAATVPASAAGRRLPRGRHIARVTVSNDAGGSVIAVTYASGPRQRVRFLHSAEVIDRVALTDVDNDGQVDIVAAPHARAAGLILWHNQGNGRFTLNAIARDAKPAPSRGPRFVRYRHADDGWQWGDERYDAAMPRAPAIGSTDAVAFVSVLSEDSAPVVPLPRLPGRAPPIA